MGKRMCSCFLVGHPLSCRKALYFNDKYYGSWCDRHDAKRSIHGDLLIIWVVFANVWGHNFHSLKSLVWHDSQFRWMFWELGRYSAVSVIQFTIKYSQISFKILLSSALVPPPIFTKWDRAVMLLICKWTDFGFFTLQNNSVANFAAFISKAFMWSCASSLFHRPPTVSPWQCATQPPDFAASDWIIISAVWIVIGFSLFKFRFWHHHFSFSNEAAFRLIFSLQERLASVLLSGTFVMTSNVEEPRGVLCMSK